MPSQTNSSLRELFKKSILDRLYIPQKQYWKHKLQQIIEENRLLYQKPSSCGLHYLGKNWDGQYPFIYLDDLTYLLIHPELIPKEAEILEIVTQLSELEVEEYEVTRFLSGLVLFPAPIAAFEKALGKSVYQEIRKLFPQGSIQENYEDKCLWDDNANAAFMTYIKHHEYLQKVMNQRLLINLITQDQPKQ